MAKRLVELTLRLGAADRERGMVEETAGESPAAAAVAVVVLVLEVAGLVVCWS